MIPYRRRLIGALTLAIAAALAGYTYGSAHAPRTPSIPATTVASPPPGSLRIIYSLEAKQNNRELIALIDAAEKHIYFAIYTFTLKDVAEALARAKARGVDVRGVMDSGQAEEQFSAPVLDILRAANIPIVVEKHPTGSGIMHIKTLVTDKAYATGSYNWTNSATTLNDEILEIGTDPALRQIYEDFLLRLLTAYQGNTAAAHAAASRSIGTIDYSEAPAHIGETARVTGTLYKAYTAKSGVTFLDFCKDYKTCPFTAVIFADDLKAFPDLQRYVGQAVTLTGKISSYQGRAEIILSRPEQLAK